MHRFFVPPDSIQGDRIAFPRPVAEQIRNVLRITPGERVIVLVGDGWECEVEVTYVGKGNAAGRLLERRQNGREPRVGLTLYQCLLKKDYFEWVLQKCTEIGVTRFVPVVSERTIVRGVEMTGGAKQERWTRILTEAAEQSRRGRIPDLVGAMPLANALADCAAQDFKAVAWEEEHDVSLDTLISEKTPSSIGLLVGPEGGFSAEEVDLAREYGIQPVTLGARILRAETAAVVFATLALHRFGELG